MGGPPKPGPASAANMSKQGLSARHYAPNLTPIMVNARLPKGIRLREIKAGGAVTGAGPTGSRGWGLPVRNIGGPGNSASAKGKSKPPVCSSQTGGSLPSGSMGAHRLGALAQDLRLTLAADRSAGSDAPCAA